MFANRVLNTMSSSGRRCGMHWQNGNGGGYIGGLCIPFNRYTSGGGNALYTYFLHQGDTTDYQFQYDRDYDCIRVLYLGNTRALIRPYVYRYDNDGHLMYTWRHIDSSPGLSFPTISFVATGPYVMITGSVEWWGPDSAATIKREYQEVNRWRGERSIKSADGSINDRYTVGTCDIHVEGQDPWTSTLVERDFTNCIVFRDLIGTR